MFGKTLNAEPVATIYLPQYTAITILRLCYLSDSRFNLISQIANKMYLLFLSKLVKIVPSPPPPPYSYLCQCGSKISYSLSNNTNLLFDNIQRSVMT